MKVGVGLSIAIAALAAPSAVEESPRAFVERVYGGYADTAYNTIDHLTEIFAPPLAAEIKKDSGTTDEVGYLNGDPMCDCQETVGLKTRIESVQQRGDRQAEVRVSLDFGVDRRREVTLELVWTDDGWRVGDVATKEEPSLLKALQRSNGSR